MKQQKIYEFPIDHPLTPAKRRAVEQQIALNAHLSTKSVSYKWDEDSDVLHIAAEPIAIEVRFQNKKVELYGAAPLWARLLFTEKKKAEFKEQFESILREAKFVGVPAGISVAQTEDLESASPSISFGSTLHPTRVASRPTAQSAVRIAPRRDGVSIWSAALFGDPSGPHLREFLSRVFSVKGVAAVEIHRTEAYGWVRYEPAANAPEILLKIGQALKQSPALGPSSALAVANFSPRTPAAVDGLYLDGRRSIPLRVNRIGAALSTWRLRHRSRNRVRLAHPILLKRKDVAYRLEEELTAILGVEKITTSALTSSVAIQFNPRLLTAERLIRQLEKSWPRLLEGLDGPPSSKRFVAAGGLLGLAFTGQYLVPALRPVAVLGVAIYGLPNVINGTKQLARRQVGLPVLYSAGLTFMLLSGMPFSSTVMALLMQFWPRWAQQTMAKSQRRLFAVHRQRATWARIVREDGEETEVDIDALRTGDLIAVRGGETIPVDGVVTEGLAAVDEQLLTGAAGALDKIPGDTVYATTFVRDGRLTVRVDKVEGDTAAGCIAAVLPHARIEHLPSSAEAERIANRNAKPALALAGLSLLATRLARPSQAIIRPDYATAPRLSAQLAALYDLGDGLHRGIFFRDPAALDLLPATDIYVFDDSSALERRQIEVAAVISAGIVSTDAILSYATAAFPASQNERADALRAECTKRRLSIPQVFQRTRHAGAILYRDCDNRLLEIVAPDRLKAQSISVPNWITESVAASPFSLAPPSQGGGNESTALAEPFLRPLWVLRDGEVLGVIAFRRQGAPEGREVITALKARNKRARFAYISSHSQATAEAIARKIGISTVFGDLDPEGKTRALKMLGRRTMWIGDGAAPEAIPCIAASPVSISVAGIATARSDKADIVLLQPGLRNLVSLRRIGRGHRMRIEADYRAVYAANLLGAAGGLLAGFGSLEAGLISNIGTGYIYARHRIKLQKLISEVEATRAKLIWAAHEETDHTAKMHDTGINETEEFVEYRDADASIPFGNELNGI
jgi:manganese/zinc-transporting P-type ATPase C